MAFDPLTAMAVTGIVGSGLNFMNGASAQSNSHKANNAAQKTLGTTAGYAEQMRNEGLAYLEQMLGAKQGIFGTPEQAAAGLQEARDAINGVKPYEATSFDYGKDLEDFYDQAFGMRMNAANDAINGSQALGGNLFSSDTANKLTAQAQVLGSEAYRDAMAAYNADKGMEANIWQGNEAARQAAANSAANIANMKYGMASDTAGNLSQGMDSYYSALLGLNDDYWQNKGDFVAQIAALQAQDPGGNSGLSWFFGH